MGTVMRVALLSVLAVGSDAFSCNVGGATSYSGCGSGWSNADTFVEFACLLGETKCMSYKYSSTTGDCTSNMVVGACALDSVTDCATYEASYGGTYDGFTCSDCDSDNCNSMDPPSGDSGDSSDASKPLVAASAIISLLGAAMIA